ncbi:hypothetical protein SCUCBS95973_001355 [Sporothrix curviconia]|uniref:AAA+ ATPase domain-containing protein n=1 Tax=Sporothrix curviconia TaxID=1260050 RepID=A0ABP0AY48_9PEZI
MSNPPALVSSESQGSLDSTLDAVDTPGGNPGDTLPAVSDGTSLPEDGSPGHEACDNDNEDKQDQEDREDQKDKASQSGGNEASDNERDSGRKDRTFDDKFIPLFGTIPRVRRTGFDGFKNFYSKEESDYIIDVLEAGYSIKEDEAREVAKRGGGRPRATIFSSMHRVGAITDDVWIQRVRIKSRHILAILHTIMNHSIKWGRPRTFFRPFHAFIHYQPKAKEVLEEMKATVAKRLADPKSAVEDIAKTAEKRFQLSRAKRHRRRSSADRNRRSGVSSRSSSGTDSDSDFESDNVPEEAIPVELLASQEAVDHLQCYVDFVDKNIMHLPEAYKGTSKQRIRYSDLAYLFHPGDVVYSPTQNEHSGTANNSVAKEQPQVYQPIWKIQYTNPPSISDSNPSEYDRNHRYYISCFYIDFDGKDYGPVKYRFDIPAYEGELDIKDLPVYPIRYHSIFAKGGNSQEHDRLRSGGKDFQDFVEAKHLYYRGWTLTTSPNGEILTDSNGESMKHPEHIDSSVIVDFKATFQALPSWKPTFKEPSRMDEEWAVSSDDKVPVDLWTDSTRTKLAWRFHELIQRRDGVYAVETNSYADNDEFLLAYLSDSTGIGYQLSEENLQLLPDRVMAYVLRDRKFVQLDVHYLSKMEQQSNVFENLKIDVQHKEMVMALVDSHFRRKATKGPRHFSLGQDLIQGKGEGLVILLHGVPGVGKTATAEAVAQSNQQPLFVITCGDLGFTPKEVERSLEEIFRLAHLWDCILLLDEADIFLAERTRDDLKRNALVSVFLRVLEYYSGILFLTTNRVGTLDEAFKSRIHMSLYYPPLNRTQTLQIFEMNIRRIEEIDRRRQESAKWDMPERKKEPVSGKAGKNDDGHTHTHTHTHSQSQSHNRAHKHEPADEKDESADHLVVDRDKVMRFAETHYDRNQIGRWNGRQIRNAFQIASSLAFYDKRMAWMQKSQIDKSARVGPAVLSDDQFRKVANATLRFEKYMSDAQGMDSKGLARLDRIRADDHVAEEADPRYAQRDRAMQVRRSHNDEFRRTYGAPSSPGRPRTPQSNRRGGDDYGRSRRDEGRGYDSRYDNEGGWSVDDRDRDYDRDRNRDKPRDWDRDRDLSDRDYDRGASERGVYGRDDLYSRRGGGDHNTPGSSRPNRGGYDRDRLDDRDDGYRDYGRAGRAGRDGRDGRDERAPSSARSHGGGGGGGGDGGSGDFDNRVSSRNRSPIHPRRADAAYYEDTPSRTAMRDPSADRDRGLI